MYKIIKKNNKDSIVLPFNAKINKIKYGVNEINIKQCTTSVLNKKNTIQLSKNIVEKLNFNLNVNYKIKINKGVLEIGPVIGILLGNKTMKYNPEYMEKYLDRFLEFDKIGGLVIAFSMDCVDFENNVLYGLYYDIKSNSFKYGESSIPEFIYRRDFSQNNEDIRNLKNVSMVLNSDRITKDDFFKIINQSTLKKYLPETLKCSNENTKMLLETFKKVILKPTSLSRGRGICVIEKSEKYKVFDYREEVKVIESFENIDDFLDKNKFVNYIVQECIELEKYKDSIFDIRVVVTKNPEFIVQGIEVRLSKQGELLTNVSLGGEVISLKEAIDNKEDYLLLEYLITDLSIKTARVIDKSINVFELGLDIGLSNEGKLYLIEANSLPSFKGFKRLDMNTYLNIRSIPLKYALKYLKFDDKYLKK